jgi:PAS domain S-box-containing protein
VLSQIAVREKEEELRKLETNLPIGIIRCDPDGKIIHANNAFRKLMECQNDSINKQQNLKDFYIDESIFEMQVEQLSKCNTNTFARVYLKNCKGIEIPCRISGFLALDESGNPSFFDFAIEDSSRELMLENRRLQAQKLETIGALAGGIAHDFNNILATISGYSEMLQDDISSDSALSEKVTRIQGAVTKAKYITNQILTFSRHVEQEKIPVSVEEVLKETIGFINSSIPSNIVVNSSGQKNKAIVFADPTQLFRVFLNLMTNAIQSMEEDGGTISVRLTVVEGKLLKHELNKDIVADEYALITFKDKGKGMDQSLLTRIFEPFFTTREVGKGTGLGLSVVHGIISELEGEILVSNKQQVGTTFFVYLPICKTFMEKSVQNDKRRKILFITGNKYESRILSLALKNTGYELIYASDGRKLLKVMTDINERPDLVIYMSDSRQILPDDLLAIFNSIKTSIPCILITESNHELLEEKLLNSGIIKQHLHKPVSLKEIRNAIQYSIT